MRGPTRSASVMAATTSGWLMVWPKAMGSAVFSQARSAKAGVTKRSRSTLAMAARTFSSAMPDCRSSAIRRCMAGMFTAATLSVGELRGERVARRLVGQIQVQWRHRDIAAAHRRQVAFVVVLMLARRVGDPVVGAAARVGALDDVTAKAAHALTRHAHAFHVGCRHVGEVDVDEDVARDAHAEHAPRHV